MMNVLKNFFYKLNLDTIGWPEMLIAMYPILSSYQYGPLPFSLFILLIVLYILYKRNIKLITLNNKRYKLMVTYIIMHEILLIFFMDNVPSFFINSLVALVISLLSVLFITPYVNWNKLIGCINWVTLVSIIGIVYQYFQVRAGESVGMLKIPFLPASGLARLNELYPRPHSFFEEPAMYAQFMLIPIFISLIKKQYFWTGIIAVSVFMSSSTTGLVLIFLEMFIFIILGKTSFWTKIILFIIGFSFIWTLFNTDIFESAISKLTHVRTTYDENVRIVQGPTIVSTMENVDYIFGVPYANAYRYCIDRGVPGSMYDVYGNGDDASVYMTTIWQIILRFGIIGLFFYLTSFFAYFRNRLLLPILICFIIMSVTASLWFGPYFVFYCIFIFAFNKFHPNLNSET